MQKGISFFGQVTVIALVPAGLWAQQISGFRHRGLNAVFSSMQKGRIFAAGPICRPADIQADDSGYLCLERSNVAGQATEPMQLQPASGPNAMHPGSQHSDSVPYPQYSKDGAQLAPRRKQRCLLWVSVFFGISLLLSDGFAGTDCPTAISTADARLSAYVPTMISGRHTRRPDSFARH